MLQNRIREPAPHQCPLIHNITNYVTVNDCANMVLACGASPIMADDAAEVEDITTICGGLNINIGTLNSRTIEPACCMAGKKANALGHPVVLDPVGAGAFRPAHRYGLPPAPDDVKFAVIRGNISEIKDAGLRRGHHQGRGCRCGRQGHRGKSGFCAVAFAKTVCGSDRCRHCHHRCHRHRGRCGKKPTVIRNGNPDDEQPSPAPAASSRPSRRLSSPPTPVIRWKLLQPQCAPWALRARSPMQAAHPAGRQRHLPQLHHRCHLQYDPGSAGRGCQAMKCAEADICGSTPSPTVPGWANRPSISRWKAP